MTPRRLFHCFALVAGLLWSSAAAPAQADTLLFWDFENATSAGTISTSVGAQGVPFASGFASQTGGGPAEYFVSPFDVVHLTRFWGNYSGTELYPYVEVTLTRRTLLTDVSFQHLHNHNPGYPTAPSYQAQLEISDGGDYEEIGDAVLLSSATSGTTATVDLDLALDPGTYRIRWMPRGLHNGETNSNTEFFALNDLSLNGEFSPTWSGPLSPINADGSSVFKGGSTVPVKFALTGDSAGIGDLAATLSVAKIADGVPGAVNEAVSTSAATSGNLFRYDPSSDTYVFNWSTKGLSPGTYRLFIDLGDGELRYVDVALR